MSETSMPSGGGESERLVSWVLLGASVLIVFAMLMPTLRHGMLMGGDDPIHLAYTIELDRVLEESGSVFGWSTMYGCGAPLFVFRPPGFYIVVQFLHAVSLGQLPLLLAHKLTYLIGLMIYPLAIFYLLKKLAYRPLVCGLGALLALAPISTWGHSIEAYYDLGLAKQVLAIPLFVFALGKLHGVIALRERIMPAACLFGAMFVCHPYMAWSFVLVAGIYVVVALCAKLDLKQLGISVACVSAIVLLGSGLAAFWLVPFFMSGEIHPASTMSQRLVPLFDVMSETATAIVSHFFKGSLYDRSLNAEDVFGGWTLTSNWGWRDNSQHGRLPFLTLFSIVGMVYCAVRHRSCVNAFLLTAWLASLIIFMGPDDVPLLTLIPFQRDFQYAHYVAVLDVFTICLAAIGFAGIVCLLSSFVLKVKPVAGLDAKGRSAALAVVCGLLVVSVAVNIYGERSAGSRAKLSNRSFEIGGSGQTAWSLRNPQNVHVQNLMNYLVENVEPFERFYAHIPDIWNSPDVYHFSLAPAYVRRSNATAPVIANLMGGVNGFIGKGTFLDNMWQSEAVLDLFHISALVTPKKASELAGNAVPSFEAGQWNVYTRETGHGYGFSAHKPFVVVGDQAVWEAVCASWVRALKDLKASDLDRIPFLVWYSGERIPLGGASGVYIDDAGVDVKTILGDSGPGMAPVFVRWRSGVRYRAVGMVVTGPHQIPWQTMLRESESALSFGAREEKTRCIIEVTTEKAGLLYIKVAYYRGWEISVGGEPVESFPIGPGFIACELPPGTHTVSFEFDEINGGRLGAGISVVTLLLLGVVTFVRKKKIGLAS